MLTIYGNPLSTCTRKVLMALAETATPFEMTTIDLRKGEHKQTTHLDHQPFGRIPALDDDGFRMFESRAMCRYLNERASGKLAPSTAQGRAKMEQWISIETSEFSPHAMKFVYKHVFHRDQDAAVIEAAGKALETSLGYMDKQLAETPFLAGNDFSLAEVVFMPYFEYAMMTPAKGIIEKYPHVVAWWNTISARPTWQKAIGKA